MKFNFQKFCDDFRIQTAPRGHQHNRRGWINVICPFCSGNPGYHLGYDLQKDYFICYRCGWHPVEKVLTVLGRITNKYDLRKILNQYTESVSEVISELIIHPEKLNLPSGIGKMTQRHKDYLASRNFDPDKLEKEYGLLGTDHTGDYRFRVIAPITFKGNMVSYQGRDITDKQQSKYKTCALEREVIPHKHILYGWDQVPASVRSCIVVEGITGVWRLGPGSLATFGVEYSDSQVRLLASRFDVMFTLFDPDEAGDLAERMCHEFIVLGKNAYQLEFVSSDYDSGNMSQKTADELMKTILKG